MSVNLQRFLKAARFTGDFTFDELNQQVRIRGTSAAASIVASADALSALVAALDAAFTTPNEVNAAVNAAINSLPAEKFLASGSYNPANNILTLTLTDGSPINVDMTSLLADALSDPPDAFD